ncbi:MAG: helix-turn-helix domain-containing protein [Bacteroidia bacterium]|nr:helix-turn-helix domain-containing protein [Bacteroidia bacterium]
MEIIVFEKETYWQMQEQLMRLFRDTLKNSKMDSDEWLSPNEAMQLLGIKKGRMQQLRDKGAIKFSQHGRKIKYSKASITKYLKENIPSL